MTGSGGIELHLSYEGLGEILKGPQMAAVVHAAAERVAAGIDAQGVVAHSGAEDSGAQLRGEVEDVITDRARSNVIVKHPAALVEQAKSGLLTKAASSAGLEVHER